MPKDVVLFGGIHEGTAMFFYEQLNEALEKDESAEIVLRVNTSGGGPDYAMSVIEKVQELKDQILLKGGMSMHSAGFFMMVAVDADRVECMDLTTSVLHRAAYPDWIESAAWYKGSVNEQLVADQNKKLEKMLRNRVNVEVLESLPQFKDKNITLKDIFALDNRVEVLLTANDLKKIGVVGKINKITPAKKSELVAMVNTFDKCHSLDEYRIAASSIEEKKSKPNSGNMELTLESLKADFPSIYEAVVASAKKEGKEAEVARVKAWAAWAKVDPDRVTKAIADGTEMSIEVISELSAKAASAAGIAAAAAGNPGADAGKGKGKEGAAAPAAEAGEGTKEKVTGDQELEVLSADIDKYLGKKPANVASKEHVESDDQD